MFDYQAWLPVAFKLDGNISKLVWLDKREIYLQIYYNNNWIGVEST